MKGYWIARVDVHDPEAYKDYVDANAEPFAAFGARFLVRGGAFEAPEGTARQRNVVLEFADYDTALACYRSDGYQKAKALRTVAGDGDLVIIEGMDGAGGRENMGYWIGRMDVHDPEKYKDYVAADAAPLAEYDAEFLVRGGRFECVEGSTRSRHVLIGFRDFETAKACYHSPGYQAAREHRLGAADADFVLIEGYDPA